MAGVFFVTGLKDNAAFEVVEECVMEHTVFTDAASANLRVMEAVAN